MKFYKIRIWQIRLKSYFAIHQLPILILLMVVAIYRSKCLKDTYCIYHKGIKFMNLYWKADAILQFPCSKVLGNRGVKLKAQKIKSAMKVTRVQEIFNSDIPEYLPLSTLSRKHNCLVMITIMGSATYVIIPWEKFQSFS